MSQILPPPPPSGAEAAPPAQKPFLKWAAVLSGGLAVILLAVVGVSAIFFVPSQPPMSGSGSGQERESSPGSSRPGAATPAPAPPASTSGQTAAAATAVPPAVATPSPKVTFQMAPIIAAAPQAPEPVTSTPSRSGSPRSSLDLGLEKACRATAQTPGVYVKVMNPSSNPESKVSCS